MTKSKLAPVVVLVALLAIGVSRIAYAQEAKPAEFKLGVVDLARVNQEYSEVKASSAQVDGMKASLDALLAERQRSKLLPPAELEELLKLMAMEKPAEADTKRIDELRKKADAMAVELTTLRGKNPLTDQEKARMTELTDVERKATSDIESIRAKNAVDVQTKQDELLDKLTQNVNAAVEALAKEKGITAVVAKGFLMYGGIDMTDDLLAKLNKK